MFPYESFSFPPAAAISQFFSITASVMPRLSFRPSMGPSSLSFPPPSCPLFRDSPSSLHRQYESSPLTEWQSPRPVPLVPSFLARRQPPVCGPVFELSTPKCFHVAPCAHTHPKKHSNKTSVSTGTMVRDLHQCVT